MRACGGIVISSDFLTGDYAVAISDGQTIFDREVKGNKTTNLRTVYQPAIEAATFPTPSKKLTVDVSPPTAVIVGGSHIFCAVSKTASAGTNVACGITTRSDGYRYRAGTYVVAVSNKFALLARVEANGAYKTLTVKSQP